MKTYYLTKNVGKAKYLLSYHNGKATHKDGSPFFDIAIFSNKVKLNEYISNLIAEGYKRS